MITTESLTADWIKNVSLSLKKGKNTADPTLMEKLIFAMYLLECIAESGLKFIFKGGTSLILLQKDLHRFSLDIDILIEQKMDVDSVFSNIVKNNKVFTGFEKNERENQSSIDKAHYKFFFDSPLDRTKKYVLCDIVFEKSLYSILVEREINCSFLPLDGKNTKVFIPHLDCLLGDKLTAFAPETTGIRYRTEKSLEIVKQLYDIGYLFTEVEHVEIVKDAFIKIAERELNYRGITDKSYKTVLEDIFRTSLVIGMRGKLEAEKFEEIGIGIRGFASYTTSQKFIIEDAILSAARAGYLAMIIRSGRSNVEYFSEKTEVTLIDHPIYKKGLKGILSYSPEAYYFFSNAIQIASNEGILPDIGK